MLKVIFIYIRMECRNRCEMKEKKEFSAHFQCVVIVHNEYYILQTKGSPNEWDLLTEHSHGLLLEFTIMT